MEVLNRYYMMGSDKSLYAGWRSEDEMAFVSLTVCLGYAEAVIEINERSIKDKHFFTYLKYFPCPFKSDGSIDYNETIRIAKQIVSDESNMIIEKEGV